MSRSEQLDDPSAAWAAFADEVRRTTDYPTYISLGRRFKRMVKNEGFPVSKAIRLAILGSANTDFISAPLRLALSTYRIGCEIHSAPFNSYAHEALDPGSETHAFRPDVVLFSLSPSEQPLWPDSGDTSDEVEAKVETAAKYWLNICDALHAHSGCEIVMDNFRQFTTRPHGNLSAKLPADPNRFLQRLNDAIAARAPKYVHISDVAWLAGAYGAFNWHDDRYWHHAKQAISFQCLVPYVQNVASIVSGIVGRTRKVLVLDLDNTLWGGVIGDDGLGEIRLGQGTPEGEAYLELQRYVLGLKERGILLAICSKNELENARLPFEKHPETILKIDDFACIEANWDPKPDNLRRIADRLNLGIDSFVFLDDNPAEREIVRQNLPEVLVVELTEDPADYVRLLDACGAFEVTAISAEDRDRTRQYSHNAQRDSLLTSVSDYDEYLASLDQKAVVRSFHPDRLERITQLINKTNQFNLTTLRKTRSEVERLMSEDRSFTLYAELADCFGDNGLISVVFGEWTDDSALRIDGWLMSCRVLKRGLEKLVCNEVVTAARRRGIELIRGSYLPSSRNKLVARHYPDLGFEQIWEREDGSTGWQLDVSQYREHPVKITLEDM